MCPGNGGSPDIPLHSALFKLFASHRKKVHGALFQLGISHGQPRLLHYLSMNDGCIQRELAEHCNIEAATVTSILASMEKADLIVRRHNPQDRRILNVHLTEKGRETWKKVEEIFESIDELCFEGFTPEEQRQAIALILRIEENLSRKGMEHD